MSNNITNILIVGVGGQGTILSSRVVSGVVQNAGLDVKVSEIHGMSQRGGSVVTQVRYGENVASPIIRPGEADIIVAFELLEALRWLPSLKKGGKMIVNVQEIDPMPVIIGAAEYPKDALEQLKDNADVIAFDALATATECGSARSVNVVLLGVLSNLLNFEESEWLDQLAVYVPAEFLEGNIAAFNAGRAIK